MQEFILKPWHLVVLFLASQFNREQHLASFICAGLGHG